MVLILMSSVWKFVVSLVDVYIIGVGTRGEAPGACAPSPPSFHKLLNKLRSTLYAASNYARPIKKSFLRHCIYTTQKWSGNIKCFTMWILKSLVLQDNISGAIQDSVSKRSCACTMCMACVLLNWFVVCCKIFLRLLTYSHPMHFSACFCPLTYKVGAWSFCPNYRTDFTFGLV